MAIPARPILDQASCMCLRLSLISLAWAALGGQPSACRSNPRGSRRIILRGAGAVGDRFIQDSGFRALFLVCTLKWPVSAVS